MIPSKVTLLRLALKRHGMKLLHVGRFTIYTKARRAVVVAQLLERSILIPEVCGSNPVIGKIY